VVREVRRSVVLGGLVCLAAAASGVGVVTVGSGSSGSSAATAATGTEPTVTVRRGSLVETTTSSGSLEYAGGRDLATEVAGTLTWLPSPGRVVGEGETLYRIDTRPVVRLDGRVPAWRDLGPEVTDGPDVRQLERGLRDLGYADDHDLAVDADWTDATSAAVRDWQEDLGLDETGTLPLGSIVFADGDLRVSGQSAVVGDRVAPGTPVLSVSGTERRVTVSLETTQRHLAPIGAKVSLDFPDGTSVDGRVVDVETVAADADTEESLQVTVQPVGGRSVRRVDHQLDGTSVQVTLSDTLARGVLVVPVTALLALPAGGYAVEVVDGASSRTVPVTTGGFADASVAVDGELAVGDEVVVTP
jgi:hypothetical protein